MVDPRAAEYPHAGMHTPALARLALIPLSLVLCFAVVYWLRAPIGWVLPIALSATALFVLAPWIAQRSLARFDRDVVQLLATQKQRRLAARFRRAIGMRLFASPALVAERRGLVASEMGDSTRAYSAYRDALAAYGEEAPLGVALGFAHAAYALGHDEEAVPHYRTLLRDSGTLPRVARNLAHALARSGKDLREAERLSESLLAQAGDPPPADLVLLRAFVHARRGQRGPARKLLAEAKGTEAKGKSALRKDVERALETKKVSRRSA